jgi:hypothetical protein
VPGGEGVLQHPPSTTPEDRRADRIATALERIAAALEEANTYAIALENANARARR